MPLKPDDSRVGIVGMGYVGLPLAMAFHAAGMEVVSVERDDERREMVLAGRSPIDDVTNGALAAALASTLEVRPASTGVLSDVDVAFVCVPTPLTAARDPDLGAVLDAASLVASGLRRGQLIVLQSTTYPGTTTGPFREVLEETGLIAGQDFGLAHAPERINPGDAGSIQSPKLVGGLTPDDTNRAATLLRRLGGEVHELSSPDAAEMAKLLENTFRNVNIALVNQLALLCERMNLDVWEVVAAAATKPFGFMPFTPGPGVGGHCTPVDPYYLSWRARQFGLSDWFVEVAGDVNSSMPRHVVELAVSALNEHGQAVSRARVGVIGAAFKPDVRDARNSPSAEVLARLARMGAEVTYHDPHVPAFTDVDGTEYSSRSLDEIVGTDLVVVLVAHRTVDWESVYQRARLVVDTVNTSADRSVRSRQVLRLGAGWS